MSMKPKVFVAQPIPEVALDVLREAQLVLTTEAGRQRMNSLNTVPIQQIYERWVTPFRELWSSQLLRLKEIVEGESADKKRGPERSRSKD